MRSRLFGLLVFLALLVTGLPTTVQAADPFTDAQGRFTFTIPAELTVDDRYTGQGGNGAAISAVLVPTMPPDSQTFGNNVNVVVQSLEGMSITPDALGARALTSLLGALPTATPDGKGFQSLTVGGLPAQRYGYLATVSGLVLHGSQVVVIDGDSAYFITFTATEDTFADFTAQTNDLLTSFTFLDHPTMA